MINRRFREIGQKMADTLAKTPRAVVESPGVREAHEAAVELVLEWAKECDRWDGCGSLEDWELGDKASPDAL